ncbi:MAG: CpsB/CapC family capsule biosynthesis tyrosine phosphatase [Bacteroidota bacterium]
MTTLARHKEIFDFSDVGTDVHSHILPGLDDGAQTLDESVQCVKALMDIGFRKLIMTPHINLDYFYNTEDDIRKCLVLLQDEINRLGLNVETEAAGEYYLDYNFRQKIDAGSLLTFGSKYVLFELSYLNPSDFIYEVIFQLQTSGYKPVLAHPERYAYWHSSFDTYKELRDRGVLFQMNVVSLTGAYSAEARRISEKLIQNEMVDFIGSDLHNLNFAAAMKFMLSNKYLRKLINSGNLLNASV